jgi:hypothetical protein
MRTRLGQIAPEIVAGLCGSLDGLDGCMHMATDGSEVLKVDGIMCLWDEVC